MARCIQIYTAIKRPALNFVVVFDVAAMLGDDNTTTTTATNHIILTFRLEPPNDNPFLILKPCYGRGINGWISENELKRHRISNFQALLKWTTYQQTDLADLVCRFVSSAVSRVLSRIEAQNYQTGISQRATPGNNITTDQISRFGAMKWPATLKKPHDSYIIIYFYSGCGYIHLSNGNVRFGWADPWWLRLSC